MKKRVLRSNKEKARILQEFDALPMNRDGTRSEFKKKHSISWTTITNWRNTPEVQEYLKNGAAPKNELTARQLIDLLEIEQESLGEVIRRMKQHVK